jgi:4-amino-4-deoxy-L-arabinose transferase-like glycosyltransferase
MSTKSTLRLVLLWLLPVAAALVSRPLLPIDETRYLGVAWEMWHSGSLLVPRLNGIPYSHKPPLFFYLIHLGWLIFGVQQWSARLTAPVCGLLGLFLTARLARRLWPGGSNDIGNRAALILLSMPLWTVMSTLTMFDLPLCLFSLVAVSGLLRAGEKPADIIGWALLSLGVGLGLLTKGPVILAMVVPPGLLAPWWRPLNTAISYRGWYLCLITALAGGIGIALLWALPAARAGGTAYGEAILWGQTAGRVVKSFAHRRPWWWYLPLLPAITLPWSVRLPGLVRAVGRRPDSGTRFCLSWLIPGLVILSLTSGKQVHYLVPLLPPAALLLARFREAAAIRRPGLELKVTAGVFLVGGIAICTLQLLPDALIRRLPCPPFALTWGGVFIAVGMAIAALPPGRGMRLTARNAGAMILFLSLLHLCVFSRLAPYYDVTPLAKELARQRQAGREVAIYPGKYANQFHFSGKLDKTTGIDRLAELQLWTATHPEDIVLYISRRQPPAGDGAPETVRVFRGRPASLWRAGDLRRRLSPKPQPAEEHAPPDR